MNVKIFKLVNGEEVISEFSDGEGVTVFTNPAKLITIPTEDGGVGMALMPWCVYSDQEEYSIRNDHIIISTDPPAELYDEYNDKFGPGVYDPSKDKKDIIY